MKLTPQPHVEPASGDLMARLGPPSELFTRCEQTFVVKVDEMLWPNGEPVSVDQLQKWLYRAWNPRDARIEVIEVDE